MKNTRSRTSYGSRSVLGTTAGRTIQGTQSLKGRNLAQSEEYLQPAQLHELKLQIFNTREQTKKLKSLNLRINQKIESNTNSMNKTFEQNSESPTTSATIHKRTVEMLKRSIENAQLNLSVLQDQIQKAKRDDRYWSVKEMEQEVAVAYIEKKRIEKESDEEKQREGHYTALYEDAYNVQSSENLQRLRSILRETKETNASLRDKLSAYQRKLAKTQIELDITEYAKNNVPTKKVIEDAEIQQAEDHQTLSKSCDKLLQMEQEHEAKVQELEGIIQQQIDALTQYLQENEEVLSQNIIEE